MPGSFLPPLKDCKHTDALSPVLSLGGRRMGAETYGSLLQAHTLPSSTCPLPRGGPSGRVHGLLGTLASVGFGSRQEEGNITLLFTLIQATGDTRATGTRQLLSSPWCGADSVQVVPFKKTIQHYKEKTSVPLETPKHVPKGNLKSEQEEKGIYLVCHFLDVSNNCLSPSLPGSPHACLLWTSSLLLYFSK